MYDRHRDRLKYLTNKEQYAQRALRNRITCREYIRIVKSGSPCTDCGVKYPHYVMDFDHLGDKSFNVSQASHWTSLEAVKKEIAKCELVCANCHRERTFSRISRLTKR
jgi:hypothetical protein